MQSDLIEYSRFNQLDTGTLGLGNMYLRAKASEPILEVRSPFDHDTLLDTLGELRYKSELSEADKGKLISKLSDDIKAFFVDPRTAGNLPVQWDLVFNAAELGLIPFEALLNDDGTPTFACEKPKIILTRRIRQNSLPAIKERWPAVPRVLFAYAGTGTDGSPPVPYQEHITSLRKSLRPWLSAQMMEQTNNPVLTILPNVRFTQIEDALTRAAADKKPYTHVHILAHGVRVELPNGKGSEFGVALFKVASIDDFSRLFEKLEAKPFVVSYMICDSANAGNAIRSKKNIVQVTHRAGVPVVIGSQLPLTFPGSVCIADQFYKAILNGEDVRNAVHQTRCMLFTRKETGHDWLSFIAYVRLPEGYESSLEESLLSREMQALNTIRKDTETLIANKTAGKAGYEAMFELLKQRLDVLIKHIKRENAGQTRAGLIEENEGMIASCYKRLAELIFYRDRNDSNVVRSRNEQINYLKEALSWYRGAADRNLSHHWSVVQFLSLDRILNEGANFSEYRSTAKLAASKSVNQEQVADKIWGLGSLVELYLLSPDDEWPRMSALAKTAMEDFVKQVRLAGDLSYLTSTTLQLNRYVHWWIRENGYTDESTFPLAVRAKELLEVCKMG